MPAKRRSTDERATGANVSDDRYEEIDDEPFDEDEYEDEEEDETPRTKRSRNLSAMSAGEVDSVASLSPGGRRGGRADASTEDGWLVQVEVVEDRRIPSSADMLALYEAEIDGGGDLTSYRRMRRYAAGRPQ